MEKECKIMFINVNVLDETQKTCATNFANSSMKDGTEWK